MNVLDAYALIAYFHDEPAAEAVRSLLREGECLMNTVNLTEVLDQVIRIGHADPRTIETGLSGLLGSVISVSDVDVRMAWRAAAIRARHYHRKDRDLSLADCVLLATASPGDTIATSDAAVATTARSEGIDVLRLSGRR